LLYSALAENAAASGQYASAKSTLDGLEKQSPYPDEDNIRAAKSDAVRVRTFLAEFRKAFSPFPVPPKVDDQQFNDYLKKSIVRFATEATNAGVGLPANYSFSWSQQTDKLTYPSECIEPWMDELQEVQAILRIIYAAKVNYLEGIKRPSVSGEEPAGDDYMRLPVVTNQWGVVTPYMANFRCFSAQIANFLADIAASSNCFIVKAIYVTPSRVPLPDLPEAAPALLPVPQYVPRLTPRPEVSPVSPFRSPYARGGDPFSRGGDPYSRRFMERPRQFMPMQPSVVEPAAPAGPVTVLTESPLFVSVYIDVVKLKPLETPAAAAAPPARARRPGR